MLFRSNDTATTVIYTRFYTLSLHDALPIFPDTAAAEQGRARILSLRAREEQMRQRIAHAQAQLRTSEVTLSDTRIATPSTGVVVSRRVEPGNLAVPGQPLLILDDPRRYRLEVEVGESAMGWVRLGQSVPVTLDSIARALDGRVVEIVPRSEEHTSELQSQKRISYAVFCLKKKKK